MLVRLERTAERLHWQLLGRLSVPYPEGLRERLLAATVPDTSDVASLTQLHTEVGEIYAEVYAQVCAEMTRLQPCDLIALSGQTVYHIPRPQPARGWRTLSTLQLGEAARVAEQARVPVFSDFRQSDMAAGGQGAPLVAFGDLMLFHEPGRALSVHNLGGISNLTYLPADGDPDGVTAFDTGPANCLLDEAAARYFGLTHDPGGTLAAQGQVHRPALDALMAHPYLHLSPPKTTGREVFTLGAFDELWGALTGYDVLATLSAFTAASIAKAYYDHILPRGLAKVLVAGGGAYNATLLELLRAQLPVPVSSFETDELKATDREALAFAVMAYFAHFGLPNTLPQVTGARRAVVAGKVTRSWPAV